MLLRSFSSREIDTINKHWEHQHSRPYSFELALKVAKAVLDNSVYDDVLSQDDQLPGKLIILRQNIIINRIV